MSQTERAKFRLGKGPHTLDVKFLFNGREEKRPDTSGIRFLRDRDVQHIGIRVAVRTTQQQDWDGKGGRVLGQER